MIGRKKEIDELQRLYNSGKAELVAVYGRRRIGKTYLVDETFKGYITFRHAGLSPVEENKNGMLKAGTFLLFSFTSGNEKMQEAGNMAGSILSIGKTPGRNRRWNKAGGIFG